MVKSLAAKLGVTMDEQVAKLIEDMSNVDDIILGGSADNVAQMRSELKAIGEYTWTVARILETCGMKPKFMAVSGVDYPEETAQVRRYLGYRARLLMSKCWLTSMKGTTVPRAKLQVLVVMYRLLLISALNFAVWLERISESTNSEAIITAMLQKGLYEEQDKIYWTNRTCKIKRIGEELRSLVGMMEKVSHVSSKQNPVDKRTRGDVDIKALGLKSR